MSGAEMAELIRTLSGSSQESLPVWWAGRCAAVLEVDGLAVTLAPGGAGPELVLFSDRAAARLEDLQYTLGEGPVREASRRNAPCLVPELFAARWQWPMFAPAALENRVRAVFAFPMRLGAIRIGALTIHRNIHGALGRQPFIDALALADALTLFAVTVHLTPGGGSWPGRAGWVDLHRAQVHQAAGMIAVQLHVPIVTALIRLRAYAFAADRPILAVAQDVLDRRLSLPADPAPGSGGAAPG